MFISTLTISDEIKHETDFYFRKLSLYPSKLATIEYYISYNKSAFARNNLMCDYPTFDMYTTEDDENLKGRYSHYNYGQSRN